MKPEITYLSDDSIDEAGARELRDLTVCLSHSVSGNLRPRSGNVVLQIG